MVDRQPFHQRQYNLKEACVKQIQAIKALLKDW